MRQVKPQYQHVEDFITERGEEWRQRMGLGHIDIRHVFLDEFYAEDDEEGAHKTTAVTESKWQYLFAEIKWYLRSAVRADDEQLEKTLVHELAHVALDPEQCEIASKHAAQMELATENMFRAVWNGWVR